MAGSGVPTRCVRLCLRGGPSEGPQPESGPLSRAAGGVHAAGAPAQDTKAQEEPGGFPPGSPPSPALRPCAPGAWTLGAQASGLRAGGGLWAPGRTREPLGRRTHTHSIRNMRTCSLPSAFGDRGLRLRLAGPAALHAAGKGQGAGRPERPTRPGAE